MARVPRMTRARNISVDSVEVAQPSADLESQLERFWPGEVPDGERTLWDRLPVERKIQAVSRLKALAARGLGHEGLEGTKLPANRAATIANVSIPTLYAIEKRWRANPSLLALGVNLRMPAASADSSAETAELYPVIERLLCENPWQDAPTLFEALKRELASDAVPSFTSTLRIMRQVRPSIPRKANFGRRLVFDSAGLDLVDAEGRRMRLCALFDVETLLILGWDVVPDESGNELAGYGQAARHALLGAAHAHGKSASFDCSGLFHFDPLAPLSGVSRPQAIDMHIYALTKKPKHAWPLVQPELEITPRFKLGAELVDVIGERIGSIWLGPGRRETNESYRTSRPMMFPQSNRTMIKAISQDIYNHNQRVFAAQEKISNFDKLGDVLVDLRSFLVTFIDYASLKKA